MHPQELAFALASRRFFRGASWIARLPGEPIRLSRMWGRLASPYLADRDGLQQAFTQAFGASPESAQAMARQWFASHGLFATSLFNYRHMDADWVRAHVDVDQPQVLQALRERGGLVLSYHSHHHNTLGIVLGQSGAPTWGVASTEKASPMAPFTGRYVRIINGDSEAKFGGGRYLFTDEPRTLLRGLNQAYTQNHCVVSICDNPMPAAGRAPYQFMGRQFHVATGVLEHAVSRQVPITLALLYPDLRGHYELRLQALEPGLDVDAVLHLYFDQLRTWVLPAPWAWQGWPWFANLPLI